MIDTEIKRSIMANVEAWNIELIYCQVHYNVNGFIKIDCMTLQQWRAAGRPKKVYRRYFKDAAGHVRAEAGIVHFVSGNGTLQQNVDSDLRENAYTQRIDHSV